jgi:hypothetical protein
VTSEMEGPPGRVVERLSRGRVCYLTHVAPGRYPPPSRSAPLHRLRIRAEGGSRRSNEVLRLESLRLGSPNGGKADEDH